MISSMTRIGNWGGDHVAVVQVPQGRQQHDLITEFFEDPPVFGGQDDRLGAS